jgi:hypothetical protein
VSWVAEQAKVEGSEASDSPARLHTIAKGDGRLTDTPRSGCLVFIDLTGKNNVNGYITHIGIVESVEGTTIHSIEGNADDSGLVTRQVRELGDGYVIDYASFEAHSGVRVTTPRERVAEVSYKTCGHSRRIRPSDASRCVQCERRIFFPDDVADRIMPGSGTAFQRGRVDTTLARGIGYGSGPKNACRSVANWLGASIAGKCLPRWNSVQCASAGAGTSLRTVSSAPKTAKPCGTVGGAPQSDECACS